MELKDLIKKQSDMARERSEKMNSQMLHDDNKNNSMFTAAKIVQAIGIAADRLEKNQPHVTVEGIGSLAKSTDLEALRHALEKLDGTLHAESPKQALEKLSMGLDAIYTKPYPTQKDP